MRRQLICGGSDDPVSNVSSFHSLQVDNKKVDSQQPQTEQCIRRSCQVSGNCSAGGMTLLDQVLNLSASQGGGKLGAVSAWAQSVIIGTCAGEKKQATATGPTEIATMQKAERDW